MSEFSTVDGFVELSECLAEMIKYVANEPSVGLFYVQHHAQNVAPNVIGLRKNVVEKSRDTILHTEDLGDSITVMKSMKECGLSIADEMARDIRKSLAVMSTKQPRRGLIQNPTSDFWTGKASSWGTAAWSHNGIFPKHDSKRMSNYFSTAFRTAASNLKWSQPDPQYLAAAEFEKPVSYPHPSRSVASTSISSSLPDMEVDELPLSSQASNELQLDKEADHEEVDINRPPYIISSLSENHDDFKANKEAKLEEWLGGTVNNLDKMQENK
uniref:Uncharacterized protein LOC105130723 isoform X1 n=1 Tax=Rhizophora mucronata TaxID=61149 RepID=A0A2P2JL20_RHIMU